MSKHNINYQDFDVEKIRLDFPILNQHVAEHQLIYLDSAATSQKPKVMIAALEEYYSQSNANVHRGVYQLSEKASNLYDMARQSVADFVNAANEKTIVFTRNCSEAINLIASSYAENELKPGDEILVSDLEHHSNLLPWQRVAKKTGAKLRIFNTTEDNLFDQNSFINALNSKTKIVAISHASNVTGTIMPVAEIVKLAHRQGAIVLIDGAQAAPHLVINMRELDCDFYAFSAHKMLGPMGLGVLYGKEELMNKMEPYQLGGGMIEDVEYQNVAAAVAFAASLAYLKKIGLEKIRQHEIKLSEYLLNALSKIDEVEIVGPRQATNRSGLLSFYHPRIHAHDFAEILNQEGIAVRAGFHCVRPLHRDRSWPATVRASYYLYNNQTELEKFVEAVKITINKLG